ncbi:MAG TPA: hypothetical protein PLQ93_11025 [Bacteroidia bacterium]|nr:hypothetical protein [Bacteroidia bacterium]
MVAFHGQAQLPDTEIWLFHLKHSKDSLVLSKGINVSMREGYDNQPSFSKDQKSIYYVSVRDDKQADIYAYKLSTGKTSRITNSRESEYSPREMEQGFLDAVVVERDSAQRLHRMQIASGLGQAFQEPDSIGYYCFLNADTMLYYKLTEPHSLQLYSFASGKSQKLGDHPIRGFCTLNRHSALYGLKDSGQVTFYLYDFLIRKAVVYAQYPSLNEDIYWHPKLGLMKSEGNCVLQFNAEDKTWRKRFDLSPFGIKRITRFALDPELRYLVVVDNL